MSYNGSGTFNINSAGQPVVTGTVISSTAFNALTADLGTGLSTAITKDGQTTTTARIPFAAGINSSLVTDSTSTTTGSIITAGGVGIAKALFVGTTANIAGATTLAGVTATSITDSGLTSGRVTFASTAGLLADAAALAWDGTSLSATKFAGALNGTVGATTPAAGAFTTLSATGTLSGGTSGTAYSFSGSAPATSLTLDSSGNLGIGVAPSTSNTAGASFVPGTSTVASMTGSNGSGQLLLGNNGGGSNLAANDSCGMIAFKGRFNSTFGGGNDIASIIGTYTGNGTTRSGAIRFLTLDSGTEAERMRIDSSGNVLVTNPAGLGYGTGAGGSVTQATSKATAVTLNKPCGTITLAADALASNTTTRFSFNNSILAITDTVILIIRNGVTAGAYLVWVDGTAAGSCTLAIRNISGGSLSDAVVLNFSIIKGVTA